MSQDPKTCFVISPIGEVESDTRAWADDVFELLIEPALETYEFDVIRADMLVGSGEINSEIIGLVQNAELCIIDLTGHNANVFYECGRRHEAAKPFIQLIRAGDKLPFDVSGIRTIQYDISSPRSTRRAVEEIRKAVEQFEKSGYPTTTSGVSTTTLAQALDRMERKLDSLVARSSPAVPGGESFMTSAAGGLEDLFSNPSEKFLMALNSGDLTGAYAALKRHLSISHDPSTAMMYASMLAMSGHEGGAAIVRDLLGGDDVDVDGSLLSSGIASLGNFYRLTDREIEGVEELKRYVVPRLEDEDIDDEDKAFLANQLGMLLHSAEQNEEAQHYTLMAIKKKPDEIAYKYNLSLVYEARDLLDMAERVVDEYMESATEKNANHLGQAIDVYLQRGRREDVRTVYSELARLDPGKASLKIALNDELRGVISGQD
ncbi:hypothetical protein AB0C70_31500 [Streptomyces sp. NPDC048564]|uniref:hypothetical protein n=1 Tax=unclassified Streptomyces TaxID=2593676 RepID=UPI00343A9133